MRLTVLQQSARGLARLKADPADAPWNGGWIASSITTGTAMWPRRAGLEDLDEDLECWDCDDEGNPKPQPDNEAARRMLNYIREFTTYVTNNADSIVNYGERYRNGERISTGFVEFTINQVVSKRMVQKQ